MPVTRGQLDSFHRFAANKLDNGDSGLSWQELFALWRLENPTAEEQAEIHQAIRNGIAEADAGLGRPIDEFIDEFRAKHNIPHDA